MKQFKKLEIILKTMLICLKNDPKSFLEEEKSKFTNLDANKEDSLEEGKFDDEGGATVNNNLRVVTEEDLKKNNNALEDKD